MVPLITPYHVMTSRRRRNHTAKAVTEVDKFCSTPCGIISCLVGKIFTPKNSIWCWGCR